MSPGVFQKLRICNAKPNCRKFFSPLFPLILNVWFHHFHFTIQMLIKAQFTSVQFSCSVVSDSLQPHESQHARPPCPSPTPRAYPNSCPLNWWCHTTILSSVIPFSSHNQSFPASGSFQISSLHQVTKVLAFQLQLHSFQWIFRTDFL